MDWKGREGGLFAERAGGVIGLRLALTDESDRAQAMRLSTFGKPRIIRCREELERQIGLPRGCLTEVVELLKGHGVSARVQDERFGGRALDVSFRGKLRDEQATAAEALLAHDDGVLAATTAIGKTVVAAHCIARRAVNTLVPSCFISRPPARISNPSN